MPITIVVSIVLCFVGGLVFYGTLTSRNATIATYLVFYLILPPVSINLPGLPDLSKNTAVAMSCWLGTLVFASDRLLAFRPRWFDVPALLYMVSPAAASLSNDLTLYDAMSGSVAAFLNHVGSPYLLGRIHFRNAQDVKALAIAIFTGGLAYVLPCLVEIRLSPIIQWYVYGTGGWNNIYRLGGFRPVVFLANGLELGLWMTITSTVGYALWASNSVRQIRGAPVSWLLAVLIVVTLLCKSTGAIVILAVGVAAVYLTRRIPSKAWVLALALFPPLYEAARIADLIQFDAIYDMISKNVGADRTQSFQFRIDNENLYINRTSERMMFGWGGYGRSQVYDENGNPVTINDSRWIIAYSNAGLFGLSFVNLFMLMPACLLALRASARDWFLPELASVSAVTLSIALFNIDNLVNDMDNPIYSLGVGAVVAAMASFRGTSRSRIGSEGDAPSPPSPETEVEHRLQLGWLESRLDAATNDPARRADLARGHESFARSLAAGGRIADAEQVWGRAIELWDDLAARSSSEPTALIHAAEARNDLAWMLAARPDVSREEAARAMSWAQAAARIAPESATFRNTLAMALHRAGSWSSVLEVLGDSPDRDADPSLAGCNCLLRALAHHHLGNPDQARAWHDRARTTIPRQAGSSESWWLASETEQLLASVKTSRLALPKPKDGKPRAT